MLRATIDVNGDKIAMIKIVQIKAPIGFGSNLRRYEYRVTQWSEGDLVGPPGSVLKGELTHNRDEGALELIRKVIDDIKSGIQKG